jgi:hypothetical protein
VKLECDREQDVVDAIGAGRWPARCDEELRAHVRSCEVCADLVEILPAMVDERDAAWDAAHVPPAGVVWWRAQLRARNEAVRAVTRPLTVVTAIALLFFGALVGGAFVAILPRLRTWSAAAAGSVQWPAAAELEKLVAPFAGSSVALLLLGTWLLVAPLAIWLAIRDDAAD